MATTRARTGLSIHVGLNEVDPDQYEGWKGELLACEFDAKDMQRLAKARGFATKRLLTKRATADAVLNALNDAADELQKGDHLFVTYSGHGGQVPDVTDDEQDRMDETWVCFDRQIVDDELYAVWARFRRGVRILVLSDSCHSGTATREILRLVKPSALRGALDVDPGTAMKAMPAALVRQVYDAHRDTYDAVQKASPLGENVDVAAHVVLISGCQDNQTSADGQRNGLFTETLKSVWDGGRFRGGHRGFWRGIVKKMPPWQSPNYFTVGPTSPTFERTKPFTL